MASAFDTTAFAERLASVLSAPGAKTDAAQAIGVHPNVISRWTNGHNQPSLEHAVALADALDLDLGWLLRGDQPGAPSAELVRRVQQSEQIVDELAAVAPALVRVARRASRTASRG